MLSKFKNIVKQTIRTSTVVSLLLTPFATFHTVAAQEADTIKIGVLQLVQHEALDAVLKGFTETLDASDYAEQIEWDIQNANGDQSTLQSMSEKIARDNDILLAIATPTAQALATAETKKPIFIAAVTDPMEAGLADSLEKPGRNVTGTSDMAPIDDQVDLLVRNFPDVKTVGIIYNSSEVNSTVQAEAATIALEAAGLTVEVSTVTNTNDIAQNMTSLVEKVDAMFMVTDNTIDSSIALVGDIAKAAGIPTIGSSDSVVLTNGLATLSSSYEAYGVQTAEMVIRMLDEDLDASDMPIELAKEFNIVVNPEFAEAIGVDPESIK